MSHFYDHDGFLLPQVEYADPKRKGFYRKPTLSDARKVNALPSVTTILTLLARPGLDRWRVEQGIKAMGQYAASYALEPYPENWVAEVFRKSEEYTNWTAEFGTATHYWLSKKLREVESFDVPPMIPGAEEVADGLVNYFPEYGFEWVATEKRFANPVLGVAGAADLVGFRLGNFAIGDAKTQDEPLTPYDPEHPLQLAGYCLGLGLDPAIERWSFIANRSKPGEVKAYLWQDKGSTIEETNSRYDRMFMLLLEMWFLLNRYDPRMEPIVSADQED